MAGLDPRAALNATRRSARTTTNWQNYAVIATISKFNKTKFLR
jgi:hypothetical protein